MDKLVLNQTITEQGFPFVLDDIRQIVGGRLKPDSNLSVGVYEAIYGIASSNGGGNRVVSGCDQTQGTGYGWYWGVTSGWVMINGSMYYHRANPSVYNSNTVPAATYYFRIKTQSGDSGNRVMRDIGSTSSGQVWNLMEAELVTTAPTSSQGFLFVKYPGGSTSPVYMKKLVVTSSGLNAKVITNTGDITIQSETIPIGFSGNTSAVQSTTTIKGSGMVSLQDGLGSIFNIGNDLAGGSPLGVGARFNGHMMVDNLTANVSITTNNITSNVQINTPTLITNAIKTGHDHDFGNDTNIVLMGDKVNNNLSSTQSMSNIIIHFTDNMGVMVPYLLFRNNSDGGVGASDKRLKSNINLISGSLEKILLLNAINFEWNDTYRERVVRNSGIVRPAEDDTEAMKNYESHVSTMLASCKGKEIGYVAQDVREVIPEVVVDGADGYLSIKYEKIVPIITDAMREQQAVIEAQSKKIAELENTIGVIKMKLGL